MLIVDCTMRITLTGTRSAALCCFAPCALTNQGLCRRWRTEALHARMDPCRKRAVRDVEHDQGYREEAI